MSTSAAIINEAESSVRVRPEHRELQLRAGPPDEAEEGRDDERHSGALGAPPAHEHLRELIRSLRWRATPS